jgi:hypothetical protein
MATVDNALVRVIDSQREQFMQLAEKAVGIDFDRERGFVIQLLTTNAYLASVAKANPDSLRAAVMNICAIGLSLNPASKLAYLLPRKGTICLDISYMGMMHIAQQCGAIQWGQSIIVREKDEFELQPLGAAPIHKYKPFDENRGEIIGCYTVVKTDTGDYLTNAMSLRKIHETRNRSEAWKAYVKDKSKLCPWVTDEEEMIKKGLALDTPIPTPTGWAAMGELQVGSDVFDMNGNIVSVKAVSEIKHLKCFKVKFQNGDEIVCDDEHRWVARSGDRNAHRKGYSVLTINEMYEAKRNGFAVTVPVQGALETPEADLPIDPYLLGFWLGDGSHDRASITCGAVDLEYLTGVISRTKYTLGAVTKDDRNDCYCVGIINGFRKDLRENGLLGNKHVPQGYLRASLRQRIQLLAGLFDSDGHISKARGKAIFYNKNDLISKAVHELASSIGEVATYTEKVVRGFGIESTSYAVEWYPSTCPCFLPRKADSFRPKKIARYRTVTSIEIVDTVPTRCIAVTGETETFLAGKSMAPTHNTVIKNSSRYWPRRERLDQAVHYLNTEGGEGTVFNNPAAPDERDITPSTESQHADLSALLSDVGRTWEKYRELIGKKLKRDIEDMSELSFEEARRALAHLAEFSKRAA